ncbi:MAG: choice-of-anchor D domain-containing protein [Candidatus Kapabacteria bacterium]|nr:choice-of-anchor D domain-containing protein [Ignavibacteriota bacterium]MCW5883657.1 choice-of-anchor D domain-containing protein [Candidatus Kapabacteria bacterium]
MGKIFTIASLWIMLSLTLKSQVLTVFNIDASNFPLMRANFYMFDADGNYITNFSDEDFTVTENGVTRDIFSVSCPDVKPARALSSVLVMDASGSMGGINIQLAKAGARSFITGVRNNRTEIAITAFDEKNHLVTGFTNNKESLLKGVDGIFYNKYGWTNYNAGFIEPQHGSLIMLRPKANKKVIVFLSDGKPTTETLIDEILLGASEQEATIYSVAIRMSIQKEMRELAEKSGGKWFDNIRTEEQANNIYKEILELEQGEDSPCTIEWLSETVCEPIDIALSISINRFGRTFSTTYPAPPNSIAKLLIEPSSINFGGIRPNVRKDTIVEVTAINSDFDVADILRSNNAFTVNPTKFSLKAGESRTVTVSFIPRDSAYTYGELNVQNEKCPEIMYLSGGWPGKPPPKPTLKVVHPNGGEVFVVGSDTVITWEGITPLDTVMIEYTTDGGNNWDVITNLATGLKYDWNNIPRTPSDQCLVRVTQQSFAGFEETAISGGSTGLDISRRIVKDNAVNLIIVGYFSASFSIGNRFLQNRGGSDIFVLKFNNNGNLIWARAFGSAGNDYGKDVAIDENDNIYFTGEYSRRITFSNQYILDSRGDLDVFIAKMDANGNLQWARSAGGKGRDFSGGIAVDRYGNSTITGAFYGNAQFAYEDLTSGESYDAYIAKYNTAGLLQWVIKGSGPGNIIGRDITDDNFGNTIVVGDYRLSAQFGNQIITSSGEEDIFIAKVNPDGLVQWARSAGGVGVDYGLAVSSDGFGSPVIAGGFKGIARFGSQILASRDFDAFVAKLDQQGEFLWARNLGSNTEDMALGVTSDYDGAVALTGYFNGNATFGYTQISSRGGRDVFTSRYSARGDHLWTRNAGSSEDDTGYGITFDQAGNVVSTGSFKSVSEFGTRSLTSRGSDDLFLWRIKFDMLQSDVSDAHFSIVMPVPASQNVDMRQVMVGSVKDSLIENYIRNTGSYEFQVDTIYFKGADADAFDIVSGLPKYIVEPQSSMYTEFRFKPKRIGSHNAEIVIVTQSDTLYHTIRGTGVQPLVQVINPFIDFGIIQVGDTKDTIQVQTIRNIGNMTLYVLETRHAKPNDTDFTTISGAGPFQLKPGEEKLMDLRFFAREAGMTGGNLEFHYDGPGSPAVIQLFGLGVDLSPRILFDYLKMDDLVCESSSIGKIELTNTGINPLLIDEISIHGADSQDFMVLTSSPITIQQNDVIEFDILFQPNSPGEKNAEIFIKSNSASNSELIIPIFARKDSVSIKPELNYIDLGFICPGEEKDTVLIINNRGTIYSDVVIVSSDKFELSSNIFGISPNQQQPIQLKLKSSQNEEFISEIITVKDAICGYEYNINITAHIKNPELKVEDITINSFVGQFRDGIIILDNSGIRDITILSINNIIPPFEVENSIFPIKISSGTYFELPVRYTPKEVGEIIIDPIFEVEECSRLFTSKIKGIAGSVGAVIEIPDISAFSGETVIVPLKINNAVNLAESGITGFDIKIKFNRTLLAPKGIAAVEIDDDYAEIEIKNIPLSQGNILGNINFTAGLGDAESTLLEITEIKTLGADANIQKIDGVFNLLGICQEGGTRLFNPHGTAGINSISPNPAESEINVVLNLIEISKTDVVIFNPLGEVIQSFSFENTTGLKELNINLSEFSSGIYFIQMISPTVTDIKSFIVVK